MTDQLKSIAKGAVIAAVGAALTYVTQAVSGVDFGPYTPAVVAVFSVLANALRKALGLP